MKAIITTLLIFGMYANQGTFEANLSKSELLIKGTSTVHDWTSTVNDYKVTGVLTENEVNDLNVVVTTKSIKSGKSIMDDKTYDALQAEKFPVIGFSADKLSKSEGKISGKGILNLVGKDQSVQFTANTKPASDGALQVTGQVSITMSDFGIEPPTAMFGTITTGDEVTIQFNFILN